MLDCVSRAPLQLALWRRELPAGLGGALAAWARSEPASFDGCCRARRDDLQACVEGFDAEPWRTWLLDDLESLVGQLLRVAGASACRVCFGPIHTDQCRKFHVDHLRLRLISTYLGPGTEWLPESEVRRAVLADPPPDVEAANRAIVRRADGVRRASAGDVLLMKGRLGGGLGVVHRSPPIEQLGLVRVVLVASV